MKSKYSMILAIMLMLPTSVFAELYFSGSYGQSKYKEDDLLDDAGYTIGAGYRFNDYFSVEGGYSDLGEFKADGSLVDDLENYIGFDVDKAYVTVDGLFFDIVGSATIGSNSYLFAKLGYFSWDSDTTISFTSFPTQTVKESGSDIVFGVGFLSDVSSVVGLKVEYTRYNSDSEFVDLISAGINIYLL